MLLHPIIRTPERNKDGSRLTWHAYTLQLTLESNQLEVSASPCRMPARCPRLVPAIYLLFNLDQLTQSRGRDLFARERSARCDVPPRDAATGSLRSQFSLRATLR